MTPAGDWLVFRLATAIVLSPLRRCAATSTSAALFHESVTRLEVLTGAPLTQTSAVSSPVTIRLATAGTSVKAKVRRKKRVAAGTPAAGSPSGYQIQVAPDRSGPGGRPMNAADHSSAAASSPVSNHCGSLHEAARPWTSQTRIRQK